MKKIIISILCLLFMFDVQAQIVSVDFPQSGSTDITVGPEITLSVPASYKFVASSVPVSTCRDAHEIGQGNGVAIIDVISMSAYDGTASTISNAAALGAKCILKNLENSVLTLSIDRALDHNQMYGLRIEGLKIENIADGSVSTVNTVIQNIFETTSPPIEYIGSNVEAMDLLTCDDPIVGVFNRELTTANPNGNPILTLEKIIRNANGDYTIEEVQSTCALRTDKSQVILTPSENLVPGGQYNLKINLAAYSGNSEEVYGYTFGLRNKVKVNLDSKLSSGRELIDADKPFYDASEYWIDFGDTRTFTAPLLKNGMMFERWDCPQNPEITKYVNDNSITLSFDCNSNKDYTINAIYSEIPLREVHVADPVDRDGRVVGTSIVTGHKGSLGNNKYLVPYIDCGSTFKVEVAMDNPGYALDRWECDNELNGSEANVLAIDYPCPNSYDELISISGREFPKYIRPKAEVKSLCSQITAKINVIGVEDDFSGGVAKYVDQFTITDPNQSLPVVISNGTNPKVATAEHQFYTNGLSQVDLNLNVRMVKDYEVVKIEYSRDPAQNKGSYAKDGELGQYADENFTVNTVLSSCDVTFSVYVRERVTYLTIEEVVEDGKTAFPTEITGKDVMIQLYDADNENTINKNPMTTSKTRNSDGRIISKTTVYSFKASDQLTVKPYINDKVSTLGMFEWEEKSPYISKPLTVPEDDALFIDMNEDKICKYIYKNTFKLEAIEIWLPTNHVSGEEKKVFTLSNGWPGTYQVEQGLMQPAFDSDGRAINLAKERVEGFLFNTGRIEFLFSAELDETTINNSIQLIEFGGNIDYEYDDVIYPLLRYDRNPLQVYKSDLNYHTILQQYSAADPSKRRVVMELYSKDNPTWYRNEFIPCHMQMLGLQVSDAIKSKYGAVLKNPIEQTGDGHNPFYSFWRLEYPTLYVYPRNVYIYDNDENEPEYGIVYSASCVHPIYDENNPTVLPKYEVPDDEEDRKALFRGLSDDYRFKLDADVGHFEILHNDYYDNDPNTTHVPKVYLKSSAKFAVQVQPLSAATLAMVGISCIEYDNGSFLDNQSSAILKTTAEVAKQLTLPYSMAGIISTVMNDMSSWYKDDDDNHARVGYKIYRSGNMWYCYWLYHYRPIETDRMQDKVRFRSALFLGGSTISN